jgi:hypothetical protein
LKEAVAENDPIAQEEAKDTATPDADELREQ